MFAEEVTFSFGVPGQANANESAELSTEQVRSLLNQIEAELQRSEVFRRAVQTLEGTQEESAQFLLKAVGREAIRLSMRQLIQQKPSETTMVSEINNRMPDVDSQSTRRIEVPDITNLVPGWRKRAKLDSKVDAVQQEQQRSIARLGEQIRRAREARAMTVSELHTRTMVPLHQLKALEAGQTEHLPEDIYLRGFIRRIAATLGLNAEQLLDNLPTPDPKKAVLPSWQAPVKSKGFSIGFNFGGLSLQPMHLYVGYAALVAGGVAWLAHQPSPSAPPGSFNLDTIQMEQSTQQPQQKSQQQSQQKIDSRVSIAAPERF
jgi:cytoskeleton protein RodZ